MRRLIRLSIVVLGLALCIGTGCEDGGGDGDDCPVTFDVPHWTQPQNITVGGLWSDGGNATISNPYPMMNGTITHTERGESHTFEFTRITYHAENGPKTFTVVVDGQWTCSYKNPHVIH